MPTELIDRIAALDLLAAVLHRKQPLDDALVSLESVRRLEGRDRAFARNLAATTLRRLGQIDHLIGRCLEKPLPRRAAGLKDILRLGAVQLLFLDVADHAAVDTGVRLARERKFGTFTKLTNAVLRRLGRDGKAWLDEQDEARLNTPGWLWESWSAAYGEDTCRAIAKAHLSEAPLDLTLKKEGGAEAVDWAERLAARRLPTGTLRLAAKGAVTALPGFGEGAWWVQDMAAAMPARLLGNIRGQHVIDLCAAPGGKTLQLAAAGARVTAVDRGRQRMKRLQENLDRMGLKAETVIADAATYRPAAPADAVLLDAPCSSTGTLRRHPDVARLKKPQDAARLAKVQERLLKAAVDMVRPGGVLVYCACSLQPEEGPERIAQVLDSGAPLERLSIGPEEVGGLKELVTARGDLRTLPCHLAEEGGMDGFYAARLRRK